MVNTACKSIKRKTTNLFPISSTPIGTLFLTARYKTAFYHRYLVVLSRTINVQYMYFILYTDKQL